MPSLLTFRKDFRLEVKPADLWPLISYTDRINRAVSLPSVTYTPPAGDDMVRQGRTKLFGWLPMSWDEHPFEWVDNDYYVVRRVYHDGLMKELRLGVRMLGESGGTKVETFADVVPRHALGGLLLKGLVEGKALGALENLCRVFEKSIQDREPQPFRRSGGRAGVNRNVLAMKIKALHGKVDGKLLNRLGEHLQDAFDEDVIRMRPFDLADKWGMDRLEVLRGCLHAARAGLLDMTWDVLCPNCRVAKAQHSTLGTLKNRAHCDTCRMDFTAEFDKHVEVRFTVNAAIRPTADAVFCIGGPANAAHRFAQLRLEAGETRSVKVRLPARPLNLRALSGKKRLLLKPGDAAGPVEVAFAGGEPDREEAVFRPGEVELRLASRSPTALWAALDDEAWTDKAATAALVTSLQDFRDLFSSEVLSPGEEIGIRSLAIFFTDLKGSTALYERVGDAGAYALVRKHFMILMEAVRAYRGSVVKTIGDAVMAVFLSGEDALRASLAIQKRIHDFNQTQGEGREMIQVKCGIHMGPVIAVNSNDKLDYFGTTVNVAARVQNESEGGDVVVSRSIRDLKDVQGILSRRNCKDESFHVALKGLSDKFQLWRIWPDPTVHETV